MDAIQEIPQLIPLGPRAGPRRPQKRCQNQGGLTWQARANRRRGPLQVSREWPASQCLVGSRICCEERCNALEGTLGAGLYDEGDQRGELVPSARRSVPASDP